MPWCGEWACAAGLLLLARSSSAALAMNEDCEVPAVGEPNPCEDGCLAGAPLPPPAPQPVPPSIRIAETKATTIDEAREPTPADPRTAPQGSYNVADIPGFLRPNQPSLPPQLY